jgi:hypothetical protein
VFKGIENTRYVKNKRPCQKTAYALTENTVVQESPYVCMVRETDRNEFREQSRVAR